MININVVVDPAFADTVIFNPNGNLLLGTHSWTDPDEMRTEAHRFTSDPSLMVRCRVCDSEKGVACRSIFIGPHQFVSPHVGRRMDYEKWKRNMQFEERTQ